MTAEKSKLPEPVTPNLGEIVQAWLDGRRVQFKTGGLWVPLSMRKAEDDSLPTFYIHTEYRIAPTPHHHKALIEKWVEAPDEYVVKWQDPQTRKRLVWDEVPSATFHPNNSYRLFNKATGDLVIESPAKLD